jgi:deoxyribonuclease V
MGKFSVEKARRAQFEISKKIVLNDRFLPDDIRFVAGVDVAYTRDFSIGAAVVLKYDSLEMVEYVTVRCKTFFPYVPTLLSFREVPPTVSCFKKLKVKPDVVLVDGHGYAHPFRCGFASHLGVVINRPTVGVAKNLLCGTVGKFDKDGNAPIMDGREVIGMAVITEPGRKPIYVSVGHMISLETAVRIVKHCADNKRIPKPIQEAHLRANIEKHRLKRSLANPV